MSVLQDATLTLVGSAGTRYATGDLVERMATEPPPVELLPLIQA